MFSRDEIAEIKRLSATCTQSQIAARFGCGRYTINKILRGKCYREPNWNHVLSLLQNNTPHNSETREARIEKFRQRADRCLPLFDESDYPTGPAATRFGLFEADLFSVHRAGVDVGGPT